MLALFEGLADKEHVLRYFAEFYKLELWRSSLFGLSSIFFLFDRDCLKLLVWVEVVRWWTFDTLVLHIEDLLSFRLVFERKSAIIIDFQNSST